MLKHLTIKNYALISKLSIDFNDGFTVITGETGAGKSIILGALGLILGNRADTRVLLEKNRKCIIEGEFDLSGYQLERFFKDNELDFDNNSTLRREINRNGKTRAFINDTPVNLVLMQELGDKLVNIHSQHKTITLNDSDFQLAVVDDYSKHLQLLNNYREKYYRYQRIRKELKELIKIEKNSKSDQDYFQFQFDEIDKANLLADEQVAIEAELEILNNAEEIKSGLINVSQALAGDENGIIEVLQGIKPILQSIAGYHPDLNQILERIGSNLIDLKDISQDIERIEEHTIFDPERATALTERLNLIYHLQQKHRVNSITELLEVKAKLQQKLFSITTLEEDIKDRQRELETLQNNLKEFADKISISRGEAIPGIEESIIAILIQLGIPQAQFKIELTKTNLFTADGTDRIRFLFNANKGASLSDVAKIASGGELSRLMLAIKSIISRKNLLPTIIFDEIDMGVSGDIANSVGNILLDMSSSMQVIAITHLPQIAVKGSEHFLVYKNLKDEITTSQIRKINDHDRINEIAKMLSGEKITNIALENAREMLLLNN